MNDMVAAVPPSRAKWHDYGQDHTATSKCCYCNQLLGFLSSFSGLASRSRMLSLTGHYRLNVVINAWTFTDLISKFWMSDRYNLH